MSKENRFVIQVDPLEIEDDAIFDNKELRLYECQSDMMSDICSLLNKQDKQLADLEAKLAEKEFAHNSYFEKAEATIKFLQEEFNKKGKLEEQLDEIKQQLAEKDEEIEAINKEFIQAIKDWKSLVEKKNKDIVELEEHDKLFHNQLAIAELEKVKEKFNGKRPIDDLASEFGLELGYTATQIQNYLDQQIELLKGEK